MAGGRALSAPAEPTHANKLARTNSRAQTRAHKPVDGSLTRGAAAQDLASRLQKMFGERVFLSYKVPPPLVLSGHAASLTPY